MDPRVGCLIKTDANVKKFGCLFALEKLFNVTFSTFNLLLVIKGVMHEADNTYSIRSTWLCCRLLWFLIPACNCWQLLKILPHFPVVSCGFWVWRTSLFSVPRFCPVFWGHVEHKFLLCCFRGVLKMSVFKIYWWKKFLSLKIFVCTTAFTSVARN